MSWIIEERGFEKENIAKCGNKFLLGNGYMGYRGTMEEYGREQLVACNLLGLYDKAGDGWREPVNAPNGLYTTLTCDGEPIGLTDCEAADHVQTLDIRSGLHKRTTSFPVPGGNLVTITAERFLGLVDVHRLCMKYTFRVSGKCSIGIKTGIDGEVWDINGPHLKDYRHSEAEGLIVLDSRSGELGCPVSVAEGTRFGFDCTAKIVIGEKSILRQVTIQAEPNVDYTFHKYVAVYTGNDGVVDTSRAAAEDCRSAMDRGYEALLSGNIDRWSGRWAMSDVRIGGDDVSQLALRYSIYQLLSIAPTHSDRASIPARGLSGQVYKGAIFWDTELFMLPFFLYTDPGIAKNLVRYRIHTLDGARRKAAEYGYRGAFYAWESQDTGDDACTHFNVTDVFTGRPMRTYFRDKQIHISMDVVYGIWQYCLLTGDESILLEGGAEVILECVRFLLSFSYFKKEKNRYEILDVTGPDEYHERVNNNAFTNRMARHALEVAEEVMELLKRKHGAYFGELTERLAFETDLDGIREMKELLYIPQPDENTRIIEQFDGYCRLEDVSLKELKSRMLHPTEYLGGGNGLAASTRILKQADTVLMLNLFRDSYPEEVKKANWEFYEPRTEHGSSLSPCVYALLATDIGNPEWAYRYFLKTATIDLTGESKQYAGTIYIGGTHPAANGGAWMAAVLGFAGLGIRDGAVTIRPQLPDKWDSVAFRFFYQGQSFDVEAGKNRVKVTASGDNTEMVPFRIGDRLMECGIGLELEESLN